MSSTISRRKQARHGQGQASTSPVTPTRKHASRLSPSPRKPASETRVESIQPKRQFSSPVPTETVLSALHHATSPSDNIPMVILSPREDRAASSALPSETPLPAVKAVNLSARVDVSISNERVKHPLTPLSAPNRSYIKQAPRCESPAVTGAGDVLLPSSALPKPSTHEPALHLLPTRHALFPELDEEDEDEYTVMDIKWGQLTHGGPRVPVEVRHFDPPADALQLPALPRKAPNTAPASSQDVNNHPSRSSTDDIGSQTPPARAAVTTPLSSAASSPLARDTSNSPSPIPQTSSPSSRVLSYYDYPASPAGSVADCSLHHVAITIAPEVEEAEIGTDLEEESEGGMGVFSAVTWACASMWDCAVWGWQSVTGWWAGGEEQDTAASKDEWDMLEQV